MASTGASQQPGKAHEIPAVSRPEEREAAAQRRRAFPYRFPRDTRSLGGLFGVDENKRRLLRYFYFERRLAHALGAWTLSIPELEVNLETGRHIFYHMDAARFFRERLHEQESRLEEIDGYRDAEIDRFIEEMLSAADVPELLAGVHLVAGRALETAYRHHMDVTDPVTDAPTIRLMQRTLLDYPPMLEWAEGAIAAFVEGGVDEARLVAWRWHLGRVLGSIGGVSGADSRNDEPSPMRCDVTPFERGTVPLRDSRFTTFTNTGDYDIADGEPRYPGQFYETVRLHFIRTQRDEIDAIECFGTLLWDIRFTDFDAEHHLARIAWDEARHTEIGHMALAVAGYDPFELPNRLTSSTCRGPIEPLYAMSEINRFGEVFVIKTINKFIDEARARGDDLFVHIADFVRADERTHVRKGRHILGTMTDMGTQELEQKTREAFVDCLLNLGAISKPEEAYTLTREQLERFIGE
jgi:hypothetical protein